VGRVFEGLENTMGHRANVVIIRDGIAKAYFDNWGALAVIPWFTLGPVKASKEFIETFVETDKLFDWEWAEGGGIIDFDQQFALIWGPLENEEDEREDVEVIETEQSLLKKYGSPEQREDAPDLEYLKTIKPQWIGWELCFADLAGVNAISAYLKKYEYSNITLNSDVSPDALSTLTVLQRDNIPDPTHESKSIDETETYDESQAIEGLELSETTAEIISKYDEDYLELESVTKLSDKALNHLVNHKGGGLILGIERLSDLQARSLSKYEGQLSLINLNQLNDNAAESLSKHQGGLYLGGFNKISDFAIESLSKHSGSLSLSIEELSAVAAEYLSKHQGGVYLRGLKKLSDAAAESLSKYKGTLGLSGLNVLSDSAANHLSKHKGELHLEDIQEISDAAADSLLKHEGNIFVYNSQLSDAAAESLSKSKWKINNINPKDWWKSFPHKIISDAAAEFLASCEEPIQLDFVTELSDNAAESLSKHRGGLSFGGLKKLSDAAAESLSKYEGALGLSGLTILSDCAAISLSRHKGDLHLNISRAKRKELSNIAAESLSKHQGRIDWKDPKEWIKPFYIHQEIETLKQKAIDTGIATTKNVNEIISNLPIGEFNKIRGELSHVKRIHFK